MGRSLSLEQGKEQCWQLHASDVLLQAVACMCGTACCGLLLILLMA